MGGGWGVGGDGNGGAAAAAAAAAAAVQRGGLQQDLLAKYEALQLECAQSNESLRLARKAAASQEAYLGVLETEASEAARRNEAQQRRLEALTAETSKLRKEVTKLRSDATSVRMSAFEVDLLQQELKVAKDAAGAMEAQLQRMHAENASLREGGGLEAELELASEQLKTALEGKELLRVGLMAQVRRAQSELKVLSTALAEGERERQGIELAFEIEIERRLRSHEGAQHASALVSVTSRLTVLVDDGALRWALHTWAAAAPFAEMGVVFGVVTQRVQALALSAEAMERELTNLQLAEAGGLAIGQLRLLHDTTTESLLTELKCTEEAAQLHERLHAGERLCLPPIATECL